MPLQPPPDQPPHLSLEFLDRADLDAVPALGAQKLADALDLVDAWGGEEDARVWIGPG